MANSTTVTAKMSEEALDQIQKFHSTTPFGRDLLKHFSMESGYINVNHGSYGSPMKAILTEMHYWQAKMNANPERWFRYEVQKRLDAARMSIAEYIGATRPSDIAFVPNASAGVNAVLRSLQLAPGDKLMFLDIAYGMVKKTMQYLENSRGVELIEVMMPNPYDEAGLLAKVAEEFQKNSGQVRLACFSHISSVPTCILPVAALARLCRDNGALSLIDGAHTLGQIDFNITSLDVDFYVTNAHKWLYTPRVAAILWTRQELHALVHPTVISWNYQLGYALEFDNIGTYDYTVYLTIPAALELRRRLGDARIKAYIHELATWAGKRVAEIWGTDNEDHFTTSADQIAGMINVRLPTDDVCIINGLNDRLLLSYNTFVATFPFRGHWYVRLSAQIYNEKEDFEYVANAVLGTIRELSSKLQTLNQTDTKFIRTK